MSVTVTDPTALVAMPAEQFERLRGCLRRAAFYERVGTQAATGIFLELNTAQTLLETWAFEQCNRCASPVEPLAPLCGFHLEEARLQAVADERERDGDLEGML
jgi:hypothetical protein